MSFVGRSIRNGGKKLRLNAEPQSLGLTLMGDSMADDEHRAIQHNKSNKHKHNKGHRVNKDAVQPHHEALSSSQEQHRTHDWIMSSGLFEVYYVVTIMAFETLVLPPSNSCL